MNVSPGPFKVVDWWMSYLNYQVRSCHNRYQHLPTAYSTYPLQKLTRNPTLHYYPNPTLQIEHHMFPSMPQFRHPTVSPRVKAMLEKHGLQYDQRSYVDAITVTFQNLHKVGSDVFYG
jgi:fatty acid desaturase